MFEPGVLIQFVLATLLFLITPGPCLTLMVSTCISHGKLSAMSVVWGIAFSDVLGSLLIAFGLAVWLLQVPSALLALKVFGIGYLLFATYSEWRSVNPVRNRDPLTLPLTQSKGFWRGFWINMLNPAWLLLMGYFPQFIRPELGGMQLQLGALALLYCVLSTAFGALIVYLSSGAERFLKSASGGVRSGYFLVAAYGVLAVYFVIRF